MKRFRFSTIIVVLAVALSACSAQVDLVDPKIPKLLINKIPVNVAVKYPEEFNHYVYQEDVLGDKKWTIDLGNANAKLFDNLFSAMFTSVYRMKEGESLDSLAFDAYIEPSIEAFEFSIPAMSRTDAYAVWIRYRLKIFDANGTQISNWPVSAYGKRQTGKIGGEKAVRRAAILAMRDATALISIQMDKATGISKLAAGAPPSSLPIKDTTEISNTGSGEEVTPNNGE